MYFLKHIILQSKFGKKIVLLKMIINKLIKRCKNFFIKLFEKVLFNINLFVCEKHVFSTYLLLVIVY